MQRECGGRSALADKTVHDVKNEFIIKETKHTKEPYIQVLKSRILASRLGMNLGPVCGTELDENCNYVSEKSNVFVSFSYEMKFLELFDILKEHFTAECDTTYFWTSFLSMSQFDEGKGKPQYNVKFWSDIFMKAIKDIGRTVLVITDNWKDPVVLKRSWCIW